MTKKKTKAKAKTKRRKSKLKFLCDKISTIFHNLCGHQLSVISSFNSFVNLMHHEVDAASLGIGRMLFGKLFMTK